MHKNDFFYYNGYNELAVKKCIDIRKSNGDTIEMASEKTKLPTTRISLVEKGIEKIDVNFLAAYAYGYHTSISYLVGERKTAYSNFYHNRYL